MDQVCDGTIDCRWGGDELFCNKSYKCIGQCICSLDYSHIFCPFETFQNDIIKKRTIIESFKTIKIYNILNISIFRNISSKYITYLNISNGKIKEICYLNIPNLIVYDLSNNIIKILTNKSLEYKNLRYLFINGNLLNSINGEIFKYLTNLYTLDISNMNINKIYSKTFNGLINLKILKLINYNLLFIDKINPFKRLINLEYIYLNNVIFSINIDFKFMKELNKLKFIITNEIIICCFGKKYSKYLKECIENDDKYITCDDLLPINSLRLIIWIICCIGLIGNIFGFFIKIKTLHKFSDLFYIDLCISDFFMIIYITFIGSFDHYYSNKYFEYDKIWRLGVMCKILGSFSIYSILSSTFSVFLITIERYLIIKRPFLIYFNKDKVILLLSMKTLLISLLITITFVSYEVNFYFILFYYKKHEINIQ